MDLSVELYLGDCLDVLKGIPDKIVDFGFVDPPYNIGKDYGTYKDDLPEEEYFNWCIKWLTELKRVCKTFAVYPPKKNLLWFYNQLPDHHQIICAWSPEGAIRNNFIHQYIPLLVPNKPVKRTKDHWWNVQVPGMGYFYKEKKYNHPGQTSLDITGRVIDSFSVNGETILDCFMGTGTSGYWSVKHDRNFIGIEIDPTYYSIADKRIKEAQMQLSLNLIINE
jgi:site-specific DNA-methyltransferase (adenine-specific)